jgi:hypothetical protein
VSSPKDIPAPTEAELLKLLYSGSERHPSYRFLCETRHVAGEAMSNAVATELGRQVVPTERARSLVAYLLSLNSTYTYPEARPMQAAKQETAAHGPAPAKHEVTPVPAAAPDEKKPEQKK